MTLTLLVNGQSHPLDIDPATPLLYALRGELGLNGAKFGCGLGQCGACTVIVDGAPVFSCLVPVAALEGRQITTIEGLGSAAAPGPLQQAFIDEQAAHCGYCYNGLTIKASELLAQNPRPSETEIRTHMNGHLCRCGTYPRVMKAIQLASARITGEPR